MQLLDFLFGYWGGGPRFFADGWGDVGLYQALRPQALLAKEIGPAKVKFLAAHRDHGGILYEGKFRSPERRLPKRSRTAHVRFLVPEEGNLRGAVLILAASGDQGFEIRLKVASPLLAEGIGVLLLENPYYGTRRPPGQLGHAVRSVYDLGLMAAATFQEGRALLRWLLEKRGVPRVGVAGFSMGGQLAAMVGAAMPLPVAIVPIAASFSPDSVLREGVLKNVPDWQALSGDGTAEAARARLIELLAAFSVGALPPPKEPRAAIVVGTAEDGVVPPSDMERIASHWGAELRWIPAGHVTAVLRHTDEMRRAIVDAFRRLEATERVPLAKARNGFREPRLAARARSRARKRGEVLPGKSRH